MTWNHEEVKEKALKELEELNPGSVESPRQCQEAYEIYCNLPKRFKAIYGNTMQTYQLINRGVKSIGIFAEEPTLYPERGLKGDIGLDIKTAANFKMERGDVWNVMTGIKLVMPKGVFAVIKDRSGLAARGIRIAGGVIDPNYRGEIIANLQFEGFRSVFMERIYSGAIAFKTMALERIRFKKGQRIGQLVFFPDIEYFFYPIFDERLIEQTNRGERRFGSTGIDTKGI